MNFRTYRERMGWTLAEAARLLEFDDGSTVARHEIGATLPKPEAIARYEKLTAGEVTLDDFLQARRQFRRDPDKARARIGARKLDRQPTPT